MEKHRTVEADFPKLKFLRFSNIALDFCAAVRRTLRRCGAFAIHGTRKSSTDSAHRKR